MQPETHFRPLAAAVSPSPCQRERRVVLVFDGHPQTYKQTAYKIESPLFAIIPSVLPTQSTATWNSYTSSSLRADLQEIKTTSTSAASPSMSRSTVYATNNDTLEKLWYKPVPGRGLALSCIGTEVLSSKELRGRDSA